MRKTAIATTTAIALIGVSSQALAQAEQTVTPATAPLEVAEFCLDQLTRFTEQVAEEGYWFVGFRGGWGGTGYATPPPAGVAAPRAPDAPPPAVDAPAPPAAEPPVGVADWGPLGAAAWPISPSFELRSLQSAAAVLGYRGDSEGCNFVHGRLQQTYDEYVMQLEELGVEPGDVTLWRQEQIAAAMPVTEIDHVLSTGEVIGMEVRSPADGHLGNIEDVVMAPDDNTIDFVIVGVGGFFGFAMDYVGVPWEDLLITPGFEAFILDASEEQVANAPQVDPDRARTRAAHAEWAEEIESYWQ